MRSITLILICTLLPGCMAATPNDLKSDYVYFQFVDSWDGVQRACGREGKSPWYACAYNKGEICHIVLQREDWWLHVVHELEHCWNQRPDET